MREGVIFREWSMIFCEATTSSGCDSSVRQNAVYTRRNDLIAVPGRFGWDGGLGTSGYSDPSEELVGILMTQLGWSSATGPQLWSDFWTSVYQSIDD